MSNLTAQHIASSNSDDAFEYLLELLSHKFRARNISIVPYIGATMQTFPKLSPQAKEQALSQLKQRVDLEGASCAIGADNTSLQFLWAVLSKYSLKPNSDLFERVSENDVIEVFLANHSAMFHSFSFYDFCSYSLEDLFTRPWQELYSRESEFEKIMHENALKLLSGQKSCIEAADVPQHTVTETLSPFKYQIEYNLKFSYPLIGRTTNKPEGIAVVTKPKLLSQIAAADEELLLNSFHTSP